MLDEKKSSQISFLEIGSGDVIAAAEVIQPWPTERTESLYLAEIRDKRKEADAGSVDDEPASSRWHNVSPFACFGAGGF